MPVLGLVTGDGAHEVGLVQGTEQGAADGRIVERRMQCVHAHQADVAGDLDDRSGDPGVAGKLRQQVEEGLLPPIRLSPPQRCSSGGPVWDHRPFDPVEMRDLRSRRPVRDAVFPWAVISKPGIGDAGARHALVRKEAERAAADHLRDLLERIG